MKVTLLQETFHQPLALLNRYVNARPALPVLANILIEAAQDTITLSATNLDVTIKAHLSAKVETAGTTTVPARILTETISTLSAGPITLELQGEQLLLQSNQTQSSLNTIPAQDFPTLPQFNLDQAINLPLEVLKNVADRVLFAAAIDESRPVLTNLLVQPQDNQLVIVATDGFRLSEAIQPTKDSGLLNGKTLLLPAKLITEMIKIPPDKKDPSLHIDLTTQANQIALKVGAVECFSKLIDAAYPDYLRIIPTEFVATIQLAQEELTQAIKIASIFAKDSGALIKLFFQPSQGQVTVSAQSASLGQNQSIISTTGSGEEVLIAFNARYLLDALAAFGAGQIDISLKSSIAPMLFTSPDLPHFRHIVMPIKVEN